jgi:hypothetical protein
MVKTKRFSNLTQLDEDTALAILFGNTKRKKREIDLLTLAKNCDYLVRKYGSRSKVAERLSLSTEMIREFLIPLSLPKEVQQLILERKIDSMDVVKEVASLKSREKQVEAGILFTKLPSKDVRDIVRVSKEGRVTVQEATNTLLEFKEKNMHVFIIDLDDATYSDVKTQADKIGISPAILLKGLIQSWARSLKES